MIELDKLFTNIEYVDNNPHKLEISSTYKEGEKLITKRETELIYLRSGDYINFIRESNEIDIKFNESGLKRIFRKYNIKNLIESLNRFDPNHFILITNDTLSFLFGSHIKDLGYELSIDNDLSDIEILVIYKLSRCFVNSKTREYYIDLERCRHILLN